MKKLFVLTILSGFMSFGAAAQTTPGNSAYGHSHKKAKHHHHHHVYSTTATQRRALNVEHKTTIKTIKDNDALTNQQQKGMVKQANVTHKMEMKSVNKGKNK